MLHSWGQTLSYHSHLHCIVPGGGPSPDGTRWVACRPNFFLPVRVLSRLFRRLFLQALRTAFETGQLQVFGDTAEAAVPQSFCRRLTSASRQDWVVYAKPPFGGPKQVLAYLSRYAHRVAIANSRLVSMANGKVTFRWRDYRHGSRPRSMTLDAGEFIRRFLLHTVPDGFHRIRHFGFLANGQRVARIKACRALLARQAKATESRAKPAIKVVPAARPCPCCGRSMVRITVWYHGQAPPEWAFRSNSP
nr:transposase [Pararhodobacter oceanensis]